MSHTPFAMHTHTNSMDSAAPVADPSPSFSPRSESRLGLIDTESGLPAPSSPPAEAGKATSVRKWLTSHLQGWRLILFGSYLNVLFVFVPVAWALSIVMPEEHNLVFFLCIVALIPCVKLHDILTRQLALRIGGSRTGLINASMSNIVELVVAISALKKCELQVVQSALIGSMLSKLLLVLGLCFFAGGLRFSEQGFDATATQLHSSLLTISVGAIVLPAAYHFSLGGSSDEVVPSQKQNIMRMSHGVSIILLLRTFMFQSSVYILYLVFQLWSHSHLYTDVHNKKSKRLSEHRKEELVKQNKAVHQYSNSSSVTVVDSYNMSTLRSADFRDSTLSLEMTRLVHNRDDSLPNSATVNFAESERNQELHVQEHNASAQAEFVVRKPQISWLLSLVVLVLVTLAASFTADRLVESLDGLSNSISKEWVGLILLPAVTAVAECMTAVNVSVKDELSFSISVAIGSTIQTALLVVPFMVILGWIMGKPLSLLMDPFGTLVLYISVQTVGYVVADGKSNWLEGMILIGLYIVVAVSFWFYPGSKLPLMLGSCPIPES